MTNDNDPIRTNPLARGDKNIKSIEVYAEHAEIRKQVYAEIQKLYHICNNSQCIIVEKFLACVTPLKNLHDPGRLPVYRVKPVSPCPIKICCVWAAVSCLIQAYWKYELDDTLENNVNLRLYLDHLGYINLDYPKMKVTGAENTGYWLEMG